MIFHEWKANVTWPSANLTSIIYMWYTSLRAQPEVWHWGLALQFHFVPFQATGHVDKNNQTANWDNGGETVYLSSAVLTCDPSLDRESHLRERTLNITALFWSHGALKACCQLRQPSCESERCPDEALQWTSVVSCSGFFVKGVSCRVARFVYTFDCASVFISLPAWKFTDTPREAQTTVTWKNSRNSTNIPGNLGVLGWLYTREAEVWETGEIQGQGQTV